jgi:predicted nucleotidyltransferase
MSYKNDTSDDFTIVKRKNKKSVEKKSSIKTKLTIEDIRNNVKLNNLLNEYKPLAVILYGSLAIGKNRTTSDIDLMFIWQKKSIPSLEVLENIKKSIEEIFITTVDLVNMIYMNKQITFIDDIEQEQEYLCKDYYYIINVFNEGVIIYGDYNNKGNNCNNDKNVILFSEKFVKLV